MNSCVVVTVLFKLAIDKKKKIIRMHLGTLHMVSEPELKHLGLIGLKTLLQVLLWNYMVTDLQSCAGEAGTLSRKLQQR